MHRPTELTCHCCQPARPIILADLAGCTLVVDHQPACDGLFELRPGPLGMTATRHPAPPGGTGTFVGYRPHKAQP